MTDKKKIGKVTTKLPDCVAKNYHEPNVYKVKTKIVADDEKFMPKYEDQNLASIYANMSSSAVLPYRSVLEIDAGFDIEIPIGYRCRLQIDSKLASKGMIVTNPICESGRMVVTVVNCGRDLVTVNHGDCIAKLTIEPIYLIDW